MKTLKTHLAILLLAVLAAFPIQAQRGAAPTLPSAANQPQLFAFKTEATTLDKVLEQLTSITDIRNEINLIQTSDFIAISKMVKAPAMDLRAVSVRDVMNALNFALRDQGLELVTRDGRIWTGVVSNAKDSENSRAFYVGNLLGQFKIQDITTAIASAWRIEPRGSNKMKYHEETQLLIIFATPDQIAQADNILQELAKAIRPPFRGNSGPARGASGSPTNAPENQR